MMRGSLRVVVMVLQGAVVVAININSFLKKMTSPQSSPYLGESVPSPDKGVWVSLVALLLIFFSSSIFAAVLPDERIDMMYHGYDGGGAQINGPSILVRKNLGSHVSVSGNYYVDMVSSASIDVETTASPYEEERNEQGFTAQYLVDRSTINLGYTHSQENDYDALTYSLGIEQSFFGDLTTLGFGFSLGDDVVGQNITVDGKRVPDPNFKKDMQRRKYSVNASQILTKNLLASISIDSATDQCLNLVEDDTCLNNPYRTVRYQDGSNSNFQAERYPQTRSSDAVGVRLMYHMPWRASVRFDARTFADSWGIEASNYELRYVHSYKDSWLFEGKFRVYEQTEANFYSDLFPYVNAQNYLARDKELSPFSSITFGLGVTYELPKGLIPWIEKSTANFYWDHFDITYDDFRDARLSRADSEGNAPAFAVGQEPFYSLQADVFRLYFSFWY
jgi:Protein of unknown function (DUF3570)